MKIKKIWILIKRSAQVISIAKAINFFWDMVF